MVRYYCLALPLSAKRCADWGNGDGLPYWIHPSEPDPPWLRNSKSERIPKPVTCVIRILPWENGPENIPGTSLHVDEMGACVRNSLLNGRGVLIVAQC